MNKSPFRKLRLGFALAALGVALASSAFGQTPFATIRDDMTPVLSRTQFLSHGDSNQILHINVSLKSPNADALAAFVEDVSNPRSPHYRNFITPSEVGARFGQPASVVRYVQKYLSSQGFKIKLVGKSNLNIMADGTVAQTEKAFNTVINKYRTVAQNDLGRSEFYAYAKPIQAPATFSSQVLNISGLQNYYRPKPNLITINQAQVLYGVAKEFGAGMLGQGRTIGYSNFDGFRTSNLPLFYSQFSLPVPSGGVGSNVQIVEVDGGAGSGTPNGEGDLDMQMILGMAPQCNLIIYDGSQNETDVLTQEQNDNQADVISESYAWGFPPSDEDANHQIHLMMSAQGITYMCASGDQGTTFVNQGQAPYPDDDPEVLVVGGSIANTDQTGNRITETGWPQSGGGYSNDSAQCNALPSYQKLGTPGIPSGISYRLIPDVAMQAGGDGQQGAALPFYWNGQLVSYGSGTSFSSPMFAGGLGIAEQKLVAIGELPTDSSGHNRLGRVQDLFYSQKLRPDVWFDITSGSNGTLLNGSPSNAGPGWDSVTGLGAINFDGFVNSFGLNVGLKISPTAVIAGTGATATVSISETAGAGGDVVSLTSSDPSHAQTPASVTIPAGSSSATFTISTQSASANYTATITAAYSGVSGSATLSVNVDGIKGLSLNPSSVLGGQSSSGTVSLSTAAPSGGWAVTLKNSNPSYVTVPASVTVPAGLTTTSFTITTRAQQNGYSATLTAFDSLTSASAILSINSDPVTGLSLSPTSVMGGKPSTGTLTLANPAPSGGVAVSLASSSSNATVLSTVTVPAGASSTTFVVTTTPVAALTGAQITASEGTSGTTASLTIIPATLSSFSVLPTAVPGGTSATGTLTLNGPAPSGGVAVSMTSSSSNAIVPATVTIPAGALTRTFSISTLPVSSDTVVTIHAAQGGSSLAAPLTIQASLLNGLTVSPSSVTAGSSSTGTVILNRPAPTGGTTVSLSSSSTSVTVPSSVTILAGTNTANFAIKTSAQSGPVTATITAALGSTTKSATLNVTGSQLSNLAINPNPVVGGNTTVGTITLNGPAPSGGLIVSLSSNSTLATVPASVTVLAGANTATFTIRTGLVLAYFQATITATAGGVTKQATLEIGPTSLQAVKLTPSTVVGGSETIVTGSVVFNGPPSFPKIPVLLTSSNPSLVTVPAYVTLTSGASTATFPVTHKLVTSAQTVTITATYGGVAQSAVLTILPFKVSAISLTPGTVTGGTSSSGLITLNATPGPSSGAMLVKLASISKAISFPATVTVPIGSYTAKFTVTTRGVARTTIATITGSLGVSSQSANLTIQAPTLVSLSVSPTSVKGSASILVTGKVALTGPAPAGGLIVKVISSNTSAATCPASVLVPAGRSSATFIVGHKKVTAQASVNITASLVAITKTATLTVTP